MDERHVEDSWLPQCTYVSTVLPSRYTAGRVYATFDGHYNDDYQPYVFVSEDFGQSWRAIVTGLPETGINRIREHPTDPHFLVLAHESGVHFSTTTAGRGRRSRSRRTCRRFRPTTS